MAGIRCAVAGGTGVLGRYVVDVARRRGHDAVVLARSEGVDLTTGKGLAGLLDGVDVVVDATSIHTTRRSVAESFFADVTGHLLAAEREAGVGHHVVVSIVGIDDLPYGYYYGKRLQERVVAESDVPWTVLRATQFHEFAGQVLEYARVGPVSMVPRMLSQPIAAVEVAEAVVDLAESGPAGRVPELAGPERLQMVDLARRFARARRPGRHVVPVWVPGAAGRGMRTGVLTPSTDGPRGRLTFDAWLEGATGY